MTLPQGGLMKLRRFSVLLACLAMSLVALGNAACKAIAAPAAAHEPTGRYRELLTGQEQ